MWVNQISGSPALTSSHSGCWSLICTLLLSAHTSSTMFNAVPQLSLCSTCCFHQPFSSDSSRTLHQLGPLITVPPANQLCLPINLPLPLQLLPLPPPHPTCLQPAGQRPTQASSQQIAVHFIISTNMSQCMSGAMEERMVHQ